MFKILGSRRYRRMLTEQSQLQDRCQELEEQVKFLTDEKGQLSQTTKEQKQELEERSIDLTQLSENYKLLEVQLQEIKDQAELGIEHVIEETIKQIGLSRSQIDKLQADRADLIQLYIDKLYSLARHFAVSSRGMDNNRGLFLILADYRNMSGVTFSEFHDGQVEHLDQGKYKGIDQLPHIFSTKVQDVLSFMGERTILRDETGKVTGHEERDGALLIDLQGITFRTCMMVEGVRTYRVYDKVEQLVKGSARHNAAIYASSLEEVMAAIVVSEETSEVTLFIDGHFAKSFDPITDTEITRDEDGNFVQTESDTKAIEAVEPETEIIVEEEDYVTT
ncbi:MAG: diadenylate cyclase [Candidatus Poribacteria bacterium]|nr:diadenylate cyclase [Candidatus Poribacteria bacterium]